MLLVAASLIVFIGLVHSVLGERYILIRLFRQPLPKILGDDSFTRQTLRFAWHLMTVTWYGLAFVLVLIHYESASRTNLLYAVAVTFAITALTALIASRGRHLSWIVFGAIAIICYLSV